MINKRTITGVAIAAIISMGVLCACGTVAEQATDNTTEVITENTADAIDNSAESTTETTAETPESLGYSIEANEGPSDVTTFGLQDYEGLYCKTETEQIEDYEVTYTVGYHLKGDGTGVCYGQDEVDFTWNETEIHFADRTEPFTMEPGKLTVEDITYDKVEGKFIAPNPYYVDVENIEDGIYYAYIAEDEINETDDGLMIEAGIYTMDTYDIVDISQMAKGDVIYVYGQLFPVDTIEKNDLGLININGGLENGGTALIAEEESNCFVFTGMDVQRSYTRQGMTTLAAADNIKVIDNYDDPDVGKEYTGSDVVPALKEMTAEFPLTCDNCSIRVENGKIVEVHRIFVP